MQYKRLVIVVCGLIECMVNKYITLLNNLVKEIE